VDSDVLVERLPPLARRTRELQAERRASAALALAGALVVAWLLAGPHSPDLAAQVYRVKLFEASGFSIWDDNWYGGHHMPGYSLLFPWAALLVGMRLVGALSVLASTWAFERLVVPLYGPGARWAALCFAAAAVGDLWIGRHTFAFGVAFGVLAVLALVRGRLLGAGLLAAGCSAASPVAGLLLALAGATHVLAERRLRAGIVLTAPALAVVLVLQALFPEGGWEPFAASSVFATLAVTLAFVYALPPRERLLRMGGLLYAPVTLLSLVHTPMGSNVDRYAVLLAGPMLLAALARSGWSGRGRPLGAVALALGGILVWTAWGPVRESRGVAGDPSTEPAYYAPLERFLAKHGGTLVRVEVPFTHSHWEAALLGPDVSLARGWERQLDTKYDGLFFSGGLTASSYGEWLRREAVGYVALPDVRLDSSAIAEAALIRGGLAYLREVLHTRHWRVFAVADPAPLASSPAKLVALGHDRFTLRFLRAGSSLVRVRYTRYWTPVHGGGCAEPGPEGWTAVSARGPGVVTVAARFSLSQALGLGTAQCRGASP
jgi:hypothetical protein